MEVAVAELWRNERREGGFCDGCEEGEGVTGEEEKMAFVEEEAMAMGIAFSLLFFSICVCLKKREGVPPNNFVICRGVFLYKRIRLSISDKFYLAVISKRTTVALNKQEKYLVLLSSTFIVYFLIWDV